MDKPAAPDIAQRPKLIQQPGGLRIRLLPLQDSAQAAALIRVHAGSHDEPAEYPGMAHFLEHLLFLGSDGYPPEQSLMPFVQGCGGQLNASTRERHTDFFFQLPATQLEQGLLRLLDMLAQPLLDPVAQAREREVLHAEYLARAQDRETLCDAALGTLIEGTHPFAGFHAGNRDSLPVDTSAFQQALRDYHSRFYRSGQMELLLAGPHSVADLQQLVDRAVQRLPDGKMIERTPPPLKASPAWMDLQIPSGLPGLQLCFVLDDLPPGDAAALDYLSVWITSQMHGSLLDELRSAGLCHALEWREPYRYADQAVVALGLQLSDAGHDRAEEVIARVLGWLAFFAREGWRQESHEEYGRIRRRGLLGYSPLERLRYWVEPAAWSPASEAESLRPALDGVISRMLGAAPIVLVTGDDEQPALASHGFAVHALRKPARRLEPHTFDWRLPEPNGWLDPEPVPNLGDTADIPGLYWQERAYPNGQGALYLRWIFAGQPPMALWHAIRVALQPFTWAAKQAGVALRFEDLGHAWCLSLTGFGGAFPAMVKDIGAVLAQPPAEAFVEGSRVASQAARTNGDEMLLRQLLRLLPSRLGQQGCETENDARYANQALLQRYWRMAQRDGLALGLTTDLAGALAKSMQVMPGVPGAQAAKNHGAIVTQWRWVDVGLRAADTAVLLYCELPKADPEIEAGWRLLARLMEADFFRRLRGELQLGYALFCGFRQVAGHAGVLFAVQSPTASAAQILGHVDDFLAAFTVRLSTFTPEYLEQQAEALSRFLLDSEPGDAMERSWQNHVAGLPVDHAKQVADAAQQLQLSDLLQQLQALRGGTGGRLVLANAPAEGQPWVTPSAGR